MLKFVSLNFLPVSDPFTQVAGNIRLTEQTVSNLIWHLSKVTMCKYSNNLTSTVSMLHRLHEQASPKLYVRNGHLHIIMPEEKEIKFHTSSFHINGHELLTTLKGAENATKVLQNYEMFISQYNSKMDDIENRLLNVKPETFVTNATNVTFRDQTMNAKIRRIQRRLVTLQRSILSLKTLLTKDDCASNPCKNGGVCLDMYNGFLCQCQNGWEGPTCETDIDECTRFKGTDLGCQNGGTCQNLPGTYQCYCQNGWVGIHCSRKPTDCSSGGSEICGHGTCIPQNNAAGYKCICDPGWTTDGTYQACSVDVDECKLNHPPCSTNPLVLCTNVPGSFVCQHCPPGYTGNGYYCADINECQLFNGGCSVSPFVECINSPGSSKCGPCPSGYQGDGKICAYRGVCNVNNGGCSLLARCVDNPAISESYVQCLCPPGYTGSGMGPNGCLRGHYNSTSCSPNPCVHGTCITNNSPQGFSCVCDRRHSGTYCEREDDPCATNPCLNGGTCQKRRGKFFCKCTSGFSGKLCNKEQQGCGGSITLSNGTLSYPPTDYAVSRGSEAISCAWTITTDESMVIQINFTKFNIMSDKTCSSQWFQIHDGKNSMAAPLGRYCGTTVPLNGSVTTTHNVVYFWLRSSGQSIRKPEFEITWTAKNPVCGGKINGSSGMIVSPGWPSNYPNNRNCYWYFELPTAKKLIFHVYSLNIGHDSDCTGDFLEFLSSPTTFGRSRLSRNNELFARFCNSTIPEPFYSTSYRGHIYFKSNEKDTYGGFQIGYSVVNGIPGCGGTYTNNDGSIQSIEMTSSMPMRLTCIYEIKLSINTTIKLELVNMNLDESCQTSSIAIYQGSSTDSGLIGKYCGSSLPGPVITFGNNVIIKSTSTNYFQYSWKIKYETVCTQRFTAPADSIISLHKTGYCTYQIEQPFGHIIVVNLQINGMFFSNEECIPYYVQVRDGDSENSTLIGRYCKSGEKIKIESSTNYLWIEARLSASRLTRFTANYTSLDVGCGGLVKKAPGTISFPPEGSSKYTANKKCRWVIMAPNNQVIQLTWMTFNLEQSFDCTYDHIEVFDNNTDDGMGGSIGKYCGYILPPIMLSSSNVMTIDFTSDTTIHGDGFSSSYTFIRENNICGGNYFTSAGVIKSPGYPNNYPTNRECIWVITVPPGHQIMLNVTDFNVEAYSSCRYDWLELRNGGTSSSPLIGRYCGTTIPKLIPSHANKMFLRFTSDMSRTTQGFKIQWSSAATGCGGSLTSPSGAIMSPHYPEPYTKNTDCLWKILVGAGSKIQLIFADIDLEKHSVCAMDYVQIFDGPTINSKSLGKFCSPQISSVISSANTMVVRFKSDISFQGRGFNIQYTAICTNTLTGFGGVIESPNFPNDYPQDQNCLWDIVVPEKNKINITFSHFALERSTTFENKSCQFDYVEIEYLVDEWTDNSEEPKYEKYGRYCGDTNPGLITLNSNHARVHFVSDSLLLGAGFRLEWKLFGCGGILKDSKGQITTPNYPRPYPASIECNWIITVPLGQSIAITFEKLDVERESSCVYDFVNLYNGKDASYQMLATLCHQVKPTTVTSTGNNLFIQFKADSSYQGSGFIAKYQTEPTNCGGLLTLSSGFIFSPNYPKNYNRNETCEWLISTDEHHLIELEFEDIDLPKSNFNSTYIKVYDGPTQAYPLLEIVYGDTQLNKTITSSSDNLFIEFRSAAYITTKGFKAKYKKSCGATIKTSGSGILRTSKEFLTSHTATKNCTYTIQSEDTSKHVTLTVTFMINTEWCDLEYGGRLSIYNGPFSDSPLIGNYCGSKIPPAIVSDGSALHLEFNEAMDFFATYTVLDDQCGGDLQSQEGFFASPGWPKTYPNNIQCSWTISMGPGNTINLHFLNFDMPEADHCNTDFLEIRETNATGKLLGVYCGTNMPNNFTANGQFYLIFKSSSLDEGVPTTNKGFQAEYSLSTENKLSGPEGQIGNPGYPGAIAIYASYSWLVTTKPGTRIEITFVDYFLETGFDETDCDSSAFKVFDGMDGEAQMLMDKCDSGIPAPILSSSNIVFITLDYFSNRLDNKFLINWKELTIAKKITSSNATSSACQLAYKLEGQTNTTIISPGYPNGYAPNLNCEWLIETPSQYHVKVRFLDRNFGNWASFRACNFADVIRVYQKSEKSANWDMIKEICNNSNSVDEVTGTNLVKIEFTTNKYLNGTGFTAEVFAVCGGTLTEPSGYITYNTSTIFESECQWNITVKSGRTIKLSFEYFDLTSNNCKNYLIIRNGKFADSPVLGSGRFCGADIPSEMKSSSNHLHLKYAGQTLVKGFKLNYEEVSTDCGQHHQLSLEKTSVEISSPNYPNIPPLHTECTWTIRAPTGQALRIDFEERFDISDKRRCTTDYLELRDGGTQLAPLIGTYCYEAPGTKFSTDNMLQIKFFTNSDEPRNGFKAKISISYCGGTLKGVQGTLSSKEPHYIKAGSNCTWYIKAPLGYYIDITFPIFRVSIYTSNCSRHDVSKISLYEHNPVFGNSDIISTDTNLGIYCGRNNTGPIRSTSNEVVVNYLSKSDKDEFSLTFEAKTESCDQTFIQESGTITSPGYPSTLQGQYCVWKIQVPEGRRISIYFEDIDFDSAYFGIFEGFRDGPRLVSAPQTTIKTGETYETSDNGARILYSQHVLTNKRGFKFTFSSKKPSICVGDFNQTYGDISAPVTTKPYKCEWKHSKQTENETLAVKVTMETNTTRLGTSCRRFHTGIHLYRDELVLFYSLCSSTKSPMVFRSSYPTTTLTAQRLTMNSLNFTISYKSYKCGGSLGNAVGTISSPNFPNSPTTSMECAWRISIDEKYRVKINISSINLGNDCEKSYLAIYNGNTPLHPKIGTYCGNKNIELITTQSYTALIEYKFEEGGDGSSKGFKLSYEPEIEGCSGIFHGKMGTIATPNYDKDYPNNVECIWKISAENGNIIKLRFIDRFFIEESENCSKDFAEIFDWKDDNWISLGKKCGRELPGEITSSNTKLQIWFRSNEKITGSGFKVAWDWHCGGELEASKQERYLMSPGYPNNVKANCTYTIRTKNAQGVLTISFEHFNLNIDSDCSRNNLTIVGLISGKALHPTQQVYCGKIKPGNIRFKNSVRITYMNSLNFWSAASGFKLIYKDDSCTANITSPTVIEVPSTETSQMSGIVRYYQPRVSCSWYITAPSNQIVVLSIEKLSMSLTLSCLAQTLDIYDGLLVNQTKRLARLCGRIESESKPIPSNSNSMLIKLESTPYNFEGFKGEIYFTYGPSAGCGGTINLTETKYINSPNNLPHMDCHWIIIAPRDQKVQLEFTKIRISHCDNPVRNHTFFCTCSFIEVRDGGGPFADQFARLCISDTGSTRKFTTSWNTAYLRMYSAVAQNDVFSVTLKPMQSKCGPSQLTVTKELKELTSPDYPSTYQNDIKCTWVLNNPNSLGKVMLHFEDFDLLEEPTSQLTLCDDDRLEVTDDPNREIITVGYGPSSKYHQTYLPSYSRSVYNHYSFCGKDTKPFDFFSTGNTVTLLFQSSSYGNKGRGFKLKYGTSGCNRTIYANEGRIQSNPDDKNNCNITITADKNRTISIYFLQFYILYSNSNCSSYGFEIRENNPTGPQLLQACGYRTPNPVFSNSNQLFIRAYNKMKGNIFGQYNFVFVSSEQGKGCGGKLFNFRGKFSSPMYPSNYRKDLECTWDVKVPRGYKVALKFLVFDIMGPCLQNKVVVTTYNNDFPTEHEFCQQDVPAVLYSNLRLKVAYYSSVNNGGTGWMAMFQAVKEESDQVIWF